MRALLLAGGFGTRLRPITNHTPKCLVPIMGKPLLGYWLDLIFENRSIERAIVNGHYLHKQVEEYIKNNKWADLIDFIYEEELLGTGGTILKNKDFFGNQPFLVAHADNLTYFPIDNFLKSHSQLPTADITMMTFTTDNPQSCGIVETDDAGLVTAFHEKVSNPPGNHANGAIYIFNNDVIKYLAGRNKQIIDLSTEVLPFFIGNIKTFHNEYYLRDIGNPESLKQAEIEYADFLKTL